MHTDNIFFSVKRVCIPRFIQNIRILLPCVNHIYKKFNKHVHFLGAAHLTFVND